MLVRGRHVAGWAAVTGALLAYLPGAAAGAAAGWTRTDVGAITQPAPVSGNFLVYAHHRGTLAVVALNARSGKTVWSAPASPSHVTAGVAAFLAIARGNVFYLAPTSGLIGASRLTARDARTGAVTWQSAPGIFETWPEICPGQASVICINGTLGLRFGELRFAAADGAVLRPAPIGARGSPGRPLAEDLFDPEQRNPELLVATARGRVTWTRPLAQIFTFRNPSSDGGWNFERLTHAGIFVGSVGAKPAPRSRKETIDLGVSMTAAFRISDGRVLWRTPGLFGCEAPLPCPGSDESGYDSPGAAAEPTLGIRLVERGTLTVSTQGAPAPVLSRNASVTLQGFDPRTGKTRWSLDAGRNLGLITDQLAPARINLRTVAIRNGAGHLVALDLTTGRTRSVSASTPAWCEKLLTYHLSHGGYYGGGGGLYVAQDSLYPCTVDGHRRPVPAATPEIVGRIGASTGGLTAWTDVGTVHAER